MVEQSVPPSTVEQAGLELSLAASSAERANRPRLPLVAAIVLLVIAVIYALTQFSARSAAIERVQSARRSSSTIVRLAGQIKALRENVASRGLDPNPFIAARLEELAHSCNLTPIAQITDTGGSAAGTPGMTQRKYTARFVNQDAGSLLQFLSATVEPPTDDLRGLEISRLNLIPGTEPDPYTGQIRWNMDVDFIRNERAAGARR